MAPSQKQYLVIDLRFYASVECVDGALIYEGQLVVTDLTRTEKDNLFVRLARASLGVPWTLSRFEIPKTLLTVAPPRIALWSDRRRLFGTLNTLRRRHPRYSIDGHLLM